MRDFVYGKDAFFLKSLYPGSVIPMQLLVEEWCDKMEYEGSVMFDEYPDRVRISNAARGIASGRYENDRILIEVLLINEIHRRRIRKRNIQNIR